MRSKFKVFHFFVYGMLGSALVFLFSSAIQGQTSSKILPTFNDQFIYGIVTLESGPAHYVNDAGQNFGSFIPPGTLIKTRATIEIGEAGLAEIRLGCGSTLRLAAGSRIKIRPFGFELLSGSILARHVGNYFPLKIEGAATLLVCKDSLIDIEREGEKVLARVQVGKMKTPGIQGLIVAGEAIEASGRKAKITPFGPVPRSWESTILPTRKFSGEEIERALSLEMTGPELNEAGEGSVQPEVLDPQPTKPSKPPDGAQLGEEWMKEPIPVDENQ